MRTSFPPASDVFSNEFFLNPMLPFSVLLEVMVSFNDSPMTTDFLARLEIPDRSFIDESLQNIIWISTLFHQSVGRIKGMCNEFNHNISFRGPVWPRVGSSTRVQNATSLLANPEIQDLKRQISVLAENISQIVLARNNVERSIPPNDGPRMNPTPHVSHSARNCDYSSIGAILRLPSRRDGNDHTGSNVSGLFQAFPHLKPKFMGSGSITENLGTFHQGFMNICTTFKLTKEEAYDNLYIMFGPEIEASRFYHKHVRPRAQNLDQAFTMLYNCFMSMERRDRLLQK